MVSIVLYMNSRHLSLLTFLNIVCHLICPAQQFSRFPEGLYSTERPLRFYNIFPTTKGSALITHSAPVFVVLDNMEVTFGHSLTVYDSVGKPIPGQRLRGINRDLYLDKNGIKSVAEGPDNILYVVSEGNHFGFVDTRFSYDQIEPPPFNFPAGKNVRNIWLDAGGDLYVTTSDDTLFIVESATKIFSPSPPKKIEGGRIPFREYTFKLSLDTADMFVTEGAKKIKKLHIDRGIHFHSFAHDPHNPQSILLGTDHGIFIYDKTTGRTISLFTNSDKQNVTVTQIEMRPNSIKTWFSTLESGMGSINQMNDQIRYYPLNKEFGTQQIAAFARKSDDEFFVALNESLPAIFNINSGEYKLINDTSFKYSPDKTTDIKIDVSGNLILIKGGWMYWSKSALANPTFASVKPDSNFRQVALEDLMVNNIRFETLYGFTPALGDNGHINLRSNENNLSFMFVVRGFSHEDKITLSWKLEGLSDEWNDLPFSFADERMNFVNALSLKPGEYHLYVRVKKEGGQWIQHKEKLTITIRKELWKQWWFWVLIIGGASLIIYIIVTWRVKIVRKQERTKAKYEMELLEMEARALRAQMNPHFIFNCLNSIKAHILNGDKQKSVDYLTTFSKLIRVVFQNSDKKNITLFNEIETCRLYTQLESMRLDGKLGWHFLIDEGIDLKSVFVPALIIQPFIENAIWHGIMPKGSGTLWVRVYGENKNVVCEIEDDGIGRVTSRQNKPESAKIHESMGMKLCQTRLELEKILNSSTAAVEITDKYNGTIASGTLVKLTFDL